VGLQPIFQQIKDARRSRTPGPGFMDAMISNNFRKLPAGFDPNTKFVHVWLGSRLVILATHPTSAKFSLKCPQIQKKSEIFLATPYMKDAFGQSLSSFHGEIWKRHRSLVNPGFTTNSIQNYFPLFGELTEKAMRIIADVSKSGTEDFEIEEFFSKFTLDLLGLSIFHYDFGRIEGKNDKYYKAYNHLLSFPQTKIGKIVTLFPFLDHVPIPQIKQFHQSVDHMKELFQKIIDERHGEKKGDILDNLIEAVENGEKFSLVELRSNIFIFFLAGHETTAKALVSACICLATYQEIQEKIYLEIVDKIGKDTMPTYEQANLLTQLDNFIHELLRIHSPVTVLPNRIILEDIQYENYILPKGTTFGFHFDAIHKNPQYWPEPEVFDPDRFTPENRKGRDTFSYLPFGQGPRMCIGNNFSLTEQRLYIVRLLQNFKVLPPQHHKMEYSLSSIAERRNSFVRFVPRNM